MSAVRLDDCPVGLFRAASGELCVMTEYATTRTDGAQGFPQRDAYIVSSGEYFWGGAKTARERADVMVRPVDVDAALTMWKQANTLPEKDENERFSVYLAFSDSKVRLADWVSYATMGSEYHANGTYLGQYPQDGDALYMTDDGFDVRKATDGEWETFFHFDDGTKRRLVVVGWMEAMKPVPEWGKAEVHPLDERGIPIMF